MSESVRIKQLLRILIAVSVAVPEFDDAAIAPRQTAEPSEYRDHQRDQAERRERIGQPLPAAALPKPNKKQNSGAGHHR